MDKIFFWFLVACFMLLLFGSLGIILLGIYLCVQFLYEYWQFCKWDKQNKAECCNPKPLKPKQVSSFKRDFK